ncbi:MAG: hypothetical protein LQ345_000142 [Seirophora villosa]|nr:MAG: hypothetical protein LQ345_000142 [Seirophora villosa]
MHSLLNTLVLGVALQASFAAAVKVTSYCRQRVTANYDDIQGAAIVAKPLPDPYKGLTYDGWLAVTNAQIGDIQGSVLQVQTPPTSIFFGDALGQTSSTKNTFSVAPGYDSFTLRSCYFACVVAPVGLVGLGGAAGGVNVPVACTVRATGTKTTGETVQVDMEVGPVLEQKFFQFPANFASLKSVDFALVTTSALSGVTDVDFDSVQYDLYKRC